MDKAPYAAGIATLISRGFNELTQITPPTELVENYLRVYPKSEDSYLPPVVGLAIETLKEKYTQLIAEFYHSGYPDRAVIAAWIQCIKRLNYDLRVEKLQTEADRQFQLRILQAIRAQARKDGIFHD